MHLLCPHCKNPIELVRIDPHQEVTCTACGSTFRIEDGSTTGWSTLVGQSIGRFSIVDTVGHGGFGTVFKAHDPELDRFVAVKVPRRGNAGDEPQDVDRFLREARSVAQLRHPSIVSVHEVGTLNGTPYLVSDFVDGLTLADLLTARRPPPRETASLVAQVADALHHAHQQGIVHRDVKPSNIIVRPDGTPVVMDFGLAKREAGEMTMTMDGQILGTPAYMSPEQARGEGHRVDGRSDIYSLGVILYLLLTGEMPFHGNTRMLLHQVLHDEPKPPRKLNDKIPRDLETITLRAMAKEPARRYATASELGGDLRRFLDGRPITARPVGRVEKAWRWCRRKPAVATLAGSIAVLFISGFIAVTTLWLVATDRAEQARKDRVRAEKAEDRLSASMIQTVTAIAEFKDMTNRLEVKEQPNALSARRQILEAVVRAYEGQSGLRPDDPEARRSLSPPELSGLARAYLSLQELYRDSNLRAEARETGQKAITLYERLANEYPDNADFRRYLGHAYEHQVLNINESDQQRRLRERAYTVRKQLVAEDPNNTSFLSSLAYSYRNLAFESRELGRFDEAIDHVKEACKLRERIREFAGANDGNTEALAESYAFLGTIQTRDLNRRTEGRISLQRSLEFYQELVGSQPANAKRLSDLAHAYNQMAIAFDKPEEQRQWYTEGTKAVERAIELIEYKSLFDARRMAARVWFNSGLTFGDGDLNECRRLFEKAISFAEPLHKAKPEDNEVRYILAASHFNLGNLAIELHLPGSPLEHWQRAPDLFEPVIISDPKDSEKIAEFGEIMHTIGAYQAEHKQLELAVQSYERALKHLRPTLVNNPKEAASREWLNNNLKGLAAAQRQRNMPAAAAAASLERREHSRNDANELYGVASELAQCASLIAKGKKELTEQEQVERARYSDQAQATLRDAIAIGFKDANRLAKDPDFEPLRHRQDFQKLLADLQAANPKDKK